MEAMDLLEEEQTKNPLGEENRWLRTSVVAWTGI